MKMAAGVVGAKSRVPGACALTCPIPNSYHQIQGGEQRMEYVIVFGVIIAMGAYTLSLARYLRGA